MFRTLTAAVSALALSATVAASASADVTPQRITFQSSGTQMVGYFYAPPGASSTPRPVVVMAHGLGGLQTSRLEPFAQRFAEAGYDAVTFDYRTWGQSSGSPRNVIEVGRQQDDYRAAVAAVSKRPDVDPSRVVLWGTSLSGGHVLALGAAMPNLAGVIAQAPHVNGLATVSALPLGTLPRLTALGLEDQSRFALRQSPKYIPLAAEPGNLGALTQAGAAAGYQFVQPDPPAPGNVMAARFVLQLPFYNPDATAAKSKAPTFIAVGKTDNVTPPAPAISLAHRMGATLKEYPGGHFDVYPGAPGYEQNVSDQLAFLKQNVPVTR